MSPLSTPDDTPVLPPTVAAAAIGGSSVSSFLRQSAFRVPEEHVSLAETVSTSVCERGVVLGVLTHVALVRCAAFCAGRCTLIHGFRGVFILFSVREYCARESDPHFPDDFPICPF